MPTERLSPMRAPPGRDRTSPERRCEPRSSCVELECGCLARAQQVADSGLTPPASPGPPLLPGAHRSLIALWVEQADRDAGNGDGGLTTTGPLYGSEIALKGNLLVVGSPGDATPGQAYVYSREGVRWHLEQTLQSPTGAANSQFGSGVAISNHSIIVGAPGEDNNFDGEFTTAAGEAYVFRKSHGVWAQTQEFRPDGGGIEGFNGFGAFIVAGGGRVALSAPSATDVFGKDFGPTFVYRWEGDTLVPDGADRGVEPSTATALAVSRNRIIIGTNTDFSRNGVEAAGVLTYPKKRANSPSDTDD
jgi:hypothetical protein